MSKYRKLEDYEGVEVKKGYIFRFACCDCGLVHDMAIADEKNKKHGLAFKRNKRATAQLRRLKYGYLQQEGSPKYRMIKQ